MKEQKATFRRLVTLMKQKPDIFIHGKKFIHAENYGNKYVFCIRLAGFGLPFEPFCASAEFIVNGVNIELSPRESNELQREIDEWITIAPASSFSDKLP